ncbi:MAG TPA: RNA polymerase sigma factor SigJ [Mycobacteriales bacterium]
MTAVADLRPYLFAIAYRMLGTVGEAEDVVQEALLRVHSADDVREPKAFGATVTTRLALDQLRSARVRRERYVGTWLPEPLLAGSGGFGWGDGTDPADTVELRESLATAFLVVLETLTPLERAVFVLHDLFDFPYAEVAGILDRSEASCRQLGSRARRHVAERRPRYAPPAARREELVSRFLAAVEAGDVAGLQRMLAEDVVFAGDGGGRAPALREPMSGALRVARFLATLGRQAAARSITVEAAEVNGGGGLVARDPAGAVLDVLSLEIDPDTALVVAIHSVLNPEKLRHLGPAADLTALMADRADADRADG